MQQRGSKLRKRQNLTFRNFRKIVVEVIQQLYTEIPLIKTVVGTFYSMEKLMKKIVIDVLFKNILSLPRVI